MNNPRVFPRGPMSIGRWRKEIDTFDRALVKLLNRRARCSLAIGRLKYAAGLPLFHRGRERQIAENVRHANRGPLPNPALQHIFEQILLATRLSVREMLRAERRAQRRHAKK